MGSKQNLRQTHRNQYIHNYAKTLAGQLGHPFKTVHFLDCRSSLEIVHRFNDENQREIGGTLHQITGHLLYVGDDILGQLAACGTGYDPNTQVNRPGITIEQAANERWEPHAADSGAYTLLRVATYALIAAMADNIWVVVRRERRQKQNRDSEARLQERMQRY